MIILLISYSTGFVKKNENLF